jgi:hypothetical protein
MSYPYAIIIMRVTMGIKLEKPLRFVCDKVCDNCLIRFKCWTQRGITHLDWDDFKKIADESGIK